MHYYRNRRYGGGSLTGFVFGLIVMVMVIHAILAAVITLGLILGVAGGVALAFPAVRAILSRAMGPRPLTAAGSALARIVRG
jgi:tetrahydromethanopterin S-methyltransferase subunit E